MGQEKGNAQGGEREIKNPGNEICDVCGCKIENEDEHRHICGKCGKTFFWESDYLKHRFQHEIEEEETNE